MATDGKSPKKKTDLAVSHKKDRKDSPPKPEKSAKNVPEKPSAAAKTEVSSGEASVPSGFFNVSPRFSALTILTLLSLYTRFYQIAIPEWVCWDETHFGKMASWYINRTFFFDVHPPLGKMSIALVGYLSGYNGTFSWDKPGDKFDDHPYVGMRVYCAFLGALLVPLAFEIVYALSKSVRASSVAAACILFDTGMATLTRYILLDSPLLFFIMATTWSCVKSWHHEDRSLNARWWFWHILCGFFLSCAMCVKFVGIFIVLWVGLTTIFRLLLLWSDQLYSFFQLCKQTAARAVCLIILPVLFYLSFFAIHLAVLNRSGPGDGFYSSAFQSVLIGNPLNNATMPGEVAYGAMIALKNTKANGAYLHSHVHVYPSSSEESSGYQQVTCYAHKDDNNLWRLKKVDEEIPEGGPTTVDFLRNGDLLRLTHVVTGKNLHAQRLAAPVTKHHYQVSGYGENGTDSSGNDVWEVVIENGQPKEIVKTMVNHFRLVHHNTKCILESGTKQLPKWAWEQLEVTCNPKPKRTSFDNELFHVEFVHFPLLPNVTFSSHAPSFLKRFLESHKVMVKGNSGLKPKEGEAFSKPWQWPIDVRGQFFSAGEMRIYLLGNPIIWWGNMLVWLVYGIVECCFAVRKKRNYKPNAELDRLEAQYLHPTRWMFLGWFVHYVPFYCMGRILYYHHYFPAHMFACMISGLVTCLVCDIVTRCLGQNGKMVVEWTFGVVIALILGFSFYLFYPLVYGMSGSFADSVNSTMHGMRWLSTWEF